MIPNKIMLVCFLVNNILNKCFCLVQNFFFSVCLVIFYPS